MPTPTLADRYPVLGMLAPAEHERLVQTVRIVDVPAGTRLFDGGEPCQGFPLVLSGSIAVSKVADSGREIELYRVGPGDSCILTCSCLLAAVEYDARGVAVEDTRLALLPAAEFARLIDVSREFRRYVFRLFAERMSGLMQMIEAVAFQRLDQRLAALLVKRGPDIRASHQQLADELGSVREIVSRLVRQFAERGWLRTGRERVEVADEAALRRCAEGR